MIICLSGTPGSGKTYDAVRKIIDNIKLGRKVYTNIEGIDDAHCREYIKAHCNITDYQLEKCLIFLSQEEAEFPEQHCEKQSLVVLDEVHKLFSNRDWQTLKNKEFNEWASTHRHDGYDLILITQGLSKLDKHLRTLIEWTYFYRKINMFGALIAKHMYVVYTYSGDQENGEPLAKSKKRYDPKMFKAYKSFTQQEIKEVGFMTHTNVFKHPVFILLIACFIMAAYFSKDSTFIRGDLFGYKTAMANVKESDNINDIKQISSTPSTTINIQEIKEIDRMKEIPSGTNHLKTGRLYLHQKRDGSYLWTNLVTPPQGGRFIKFL